MPTALQGEIVDDDADSAFFFFGDAGPFVDFVSVGRARDVFGTFEAT